MKTGPDQSRGRAKKRSTFLQYLAGLLCAATVLVSTSCQRHIADPPPAPIRQGMADPLSLVLAAQSGESRLDREISRLQQDIRSHKRMESALEQLGWTFVAKARETFDPGYYLLAEQSALSLDAIQPGSHAAMLLRGHALENMHRFQEAEAVARKLVAQRAAPMDFGLLGDALMEQGHLDGAVEEYQQMVNLKPDLQAYSRIAHIRWLKGDLEGATEAMAIAATSAGRGEFAAWTWTRLANYEFQAGSNGAADRSIAAALDALPEYAPALLLRGRLFLAAGKFSEGLPLLEFAARKNPLPEYQWILADALRLVGREKAAASVEELLFQRGASADPRSFALFLATRGEQAALALRLASSELAFRKDVFTHDALAWALLASGKVSEAQREMERALSEGTQDARLFLHAGIISARTENLEEARERLSRCRGLAHTLFPSERNQLDAWLARLSDPSMTTNRKLAMRTQPPG